VVDTLVKEHSLSVRAACRATGLSRTAWYRRPADPTVRDREVIDALQSIVAVNPRWGFGKCYDRIRLDGRAWNRKRVRRVYRNLGLNLPRRTKKRVPTRPRRPLIAPERLNRIWAMDFMHDVLYCGRRFRTFNVIDEANREGLGIEAGTSIPSRRVVRILDQLIEMYGKPLAIRCDNGPELIAGVITDWAEARRVDLLHIQPGKPDQNAFIERFNRTYREEVLNAYLFESIEEVQRISDDWLRNYNENRPHEALGSLPPVAFLERPKTPRESSLAWCP